MEKERYRIVNGFDISNLENRINILIKDGWVPTGGPFIDGDRDLGYMYYQAMMMPSAPVYTTKEEKENNK